MHDAGGDDEVKGIVQLWRQIMDVVDVMLNQFGVNAFLISLLEHTRRDVNAYDIREASFGQLEPDETGAAAEVQNAYGVFVESHDLRVFGDHLSDFLWVRITESEVDALIILGDVVVVSLGLAGLVPVALKDLFDVDGAEHGHLKIDHWRICDVFVERYHGALRALGGERKGGLMFSDG